MNENLYVDRRIRKTRKLLRESLLKLMSKKKLHDITVKELCEEADVNRGTFYAHYRDVYDLFAIMEDEIFDELSLVLSNYYLTADMLTQKKQLPCFLEAFEYLVENYALCEVLLGINRDQIFIDKISDVGRSRCVMAWVQLYNTISRRDAEYFYSFTVSGCIGILQYWLSNGRKESAKELAQLAERFILQGIPILRPSPKR
ncbi:MAG: TetR-like C-terminal domain-containing protein [Oscillospiraceae bacterium]